MFEKAKKEYLQKHGFEAVQLKAVLFDMDGVLFDSMPNHARSWSQSMTQFGLAMTPEEAYLYEGSTGNNTINMLANRYWGRNATDDEIDEIYSEKCKSFNAFEEAPDMLGAKEVLEKVKAAGLKVVLVTGSGQLTLLTRLERHFPGFFDKSNMITSFDVKHGKPDPEPYLMGLEKAGVHPWEAMVVENAPLGVKSAVAARIFTLAVNTGPLPDEVLQKEGANVLLPSMQMFANQWEKFEKSLI
ncbi:MAG: HAD hydrolase-like protein [Bacteroidaceae bacterium]